MRIGRRKDFGIEMYHFGLTPLRNVHSFSDLVGGSMRTVACKTGVTLCTSHNSFTALIEQAFMLVLTEYGQASNGLL
jgi:hypothetical protein